MMKQQIVRGAFRKRAIPISPDYRPMYKVGLIALILFLACRANKSSLNKLHLLIWALKSTKNIAYIRRAFIKHDVKNIASWGVEPALNKALLFAIAEGLVIRHSDKYQLTESGLALAKKINQSKDLFEAEKKFLNYLGKQAVSESFVNDLTEKQHDKS